MTYDCEDEGHEIDLQRLETPIFGESGETLEINGYCKHCNKPVRDVYLFSVLLEGHVK